MRKMYSYRLAGAVVLALVALWAVSPVLAIPPDPDNAALLYYQAFISLPELDKEARDHLAEVARGTAAPSEKTRKYVAECHAAIDFADAAKGLQVSNWGFRYSQGFEAVMPYLAQIRFLSYVLVADARIRVLDGDYKRALERCLQMGTFARHIGDDPLVAYLVGAAVQRLGYQCMDDIIGMAAKDADLLRWLKSELVTAGGKGLSPTTALKVEMEIALNLMQMDKLDKLASILAEAGQKERGVVKSLASADEPTLERARQSYSHYFISALAILGGSKPYEQAYHELNTLVSDLDANDPASVVVGALSPALGATLSVKTGVEASANATRAAVEICLQRAPTGQFPDVLPAGLPKDPFSGQDFEYKRTAQGFTLRCRGKDLTKDKTYEFDFKVR